MDTRERLTAEVKEYGRKAKGRTELLKYWQGKIITRNQAIQANCYFCMSYYADGREDCEYPLCPLYFYMPYKKR